MITADIVKKIESFVYHKPRSIQEIAGHLDKNWRTADRYIDEIEKQFGTLATRVFRGGTRGALKIVYWASIEKISSSVFQERLEEDIMRLKRKEDFSAFDIFQHVPDAKKKVEVYDHEADNLPEFRDLLLSAEKQILAFSGNLSFINLHNKREDSFFVFDKLVKKKVCVKILSRVDIAGKENIERMLSLNFKNGKEMIEIRNNEQSLRAVIIDNKIMRIKEVKEPTGKVHELNKKLFIYYTIRDKEWIEWLTRIFWKRFSSSIDAQKRLSELAKLKFK
ncbi:hypothetical protein HYZ97_04960 [Candidatus Pacearchaeota archaeon]|nr:hypothetical protein [Candidatus Pacearchaeota archaeon]